MSPSWVLARLPVAELASGGLRTRTTPLSPTSQQANTTPTPDASHQLSSADKRYKATPTLKEIIRRRKSELYVTRQLHAPLVTVSSSLQQWILVIIRHSRTLAECAAHAPCSQVGSRFVNVSSLTCCSVMHNRGVTEKETQRLPSLSDLRRFEGFVDQLDNDPTQFAAYR